MSTKRINQLAGTASFSRLDSDHYFVLDGQDGTFKIAASDIGGVGLTSKAIKYCYLNVSAGVGTTIDLTQRTASSDYSSLVVPCKAGDVFRIKGVSGTAPRLWAFLDNDCKVLSLADAGVYYRINYLVVTAEQDGYFVSNSETDSFDVVFAGFSIQPHDFNGLPMDSIETSGTVKHDFTAETTEGGYIPTGVEVGAVVDLTNITPSDNFRSVVKKVNNGDVIKCKGIGGTAPRLWAFLDNENKLVSAAVVGLGIKDTYLCLTAPTDGTFVGGYSLVNTNYPAEYLVFTSLASFEKLLAARVEEFGVAISGLDLRLQQAESDIEDVSLLAENLKFHDLLSYTIRHCYLNVSAGVGTTIDLTQRTASSNYSSLVVPCKAGDVFRIKGVSGTAPRLWAFLDNDCKVLSLADAGVYYRINYLVVTAEQDGYFVSNSETDSFDVEVKGEVRKDFNFICEPTEPAEIKHAIKYDFTTETTEGGYIPTGVEVGAVVDLTNITPSDNFRSVVKKVSKGDIVICKGQSGNAPRLWAFLDNENKLVSVAVHSLGVYGEGQALTLTAPVDGTFIGSFYLNNPEKPAEYFLLETAEGSTARLRRLIKSTAESIKDNIVDNLGSVPTYAVDPENFRECMAVYTDGATTDFSVVKTDSFKSIVIDCKAGDVFYVTGFGGDHPRLWALTDNVGNIYDRSVASLNGENIRVSASRDGKLVVNTTMTRTYKFGIVACDVSGFVQDTKDKRGAVRKLSLATPPLVDLVTDANFLDLTNEVGEFDFTYTDRGPKNMLEQVQSKMNALAETYSDYITAVDISNETGILYPRYAQGVPVGDPDYWPCVAYTQKLYKLLGLDAGMGNTNGKNTKKKVLIIAGQHGDEVASCVDLYILARRLCEAKDEIYFKLRSACDFYLFPCVNGFGLHYFNRLNGNHVDINRNYPIRCWKPSTSGYSAGTTAGDQFETQCVVKLCETYGFDIAIDHHNYTNYVVSHENVPQQLYSTTSSEEALKAIYSSFVECSYAFIKNLPAYFGTAWKMFTGNHGAPKELQSWSNGIASRWFFESVTDISATIEVSSDINYVGGAPHVGTETEYSVDSFEVAEYTLRNQLVKLVNLSFKKLVQTGLIRE